MPLVLIVPCGGWGIIGGHVGEDLVQRVWRRKKEDEMCATLQMVLTKRYKWNRAEEG